MKKIVLALLILAAFSQPADAKRIVKPYSLPANQIILTCDVMTTCAALYAPGPTQARYQLMSLVTKPFTFSAGTTIFSSQVNQNFDTIYSGFNGNIDNTNIGAAGIFASQVICSTAPQCTFQSPSSYIFNPNNTGVTPLVITNAANPVNDYLDVGIPDGAGNYTLAVGGSNLNGGVWIFSPAGTSVPLTITGANGGQTNDYIDVSATGGLVGGIFRIDNNANASVGAILKFKASSQSPAATDVAIWNDNGSPKGMLFNVAAGGAYSFGAGGSTDVAKLQVASATTNFIPASATKLFNVSNAANTFNNLQIADLGTVSAAPLINSVRTLGPLPPTYLTSGVTGAATNHDTQISTLTCVFVANQTCTTNTVTLVGAAVFTSAATYGCFVIGSTSSAGNPAQPIFNPISATQFNFSEDSVSNNSRTDTLTYFCKGS